MTYDDLLDPDGDDLPYYLAIYRNCQECDEEVLWRVVRQPGCNAPENLICPLCQADLGETLAYCCDPGRPVRR